MSRETKLLSVTMGLILAAAWLCASGCASKGDGAAVKREVAVLRQQANSADAKITQIIALGNLAHNDLVGAIVQSGNIDKAADAQDTRLSDLQRRYDELYNSWHEQLYRFIRNFIVLLAIGYGVLGIAGVVFSVMSGGAYAALGGSILGVLDILPVPNPFRLILKFICAKRNETDAAHPEAAPVQTVARIKRK